MSLTAIEIDAVVFAAAAGLAPEVAPSQARLIAPVSRLGDEGCLSRSTGRGRTL